MGWDHDPPAREKLTPFGILMVASGALMLILGPRETSDAWADALQMCWSALERKWNGVLLDRLKVVLQCALRMTWKGSHPTVRRLAGVYPDGVRLTAKEMRPYEARLQRSVTLPKYDIVIKPMPRQPQGT